MGIAIALVAVAGTACSAVYLRRHFRLLEADARERLRPALARTACYVRTRTKMDICAPTHRMVFEITNVGQVAAVEVNGYAKFGVGQDFGSLVGATTLDLPIGAIPANSTKKIIMAIGTGWDDTREKAFCFEINLEYRAVGERRFTYRALGALHEGSFHVQEAPI